MTAPTPAAAECDDGPPGPRRVAERRHLALAAALLFAALVSWGGLAVAQIDGYRWDDGSMVPADGQPHPVPLRGNGSAMVWSYDADATPDCTAVDAATGEDLALRPAEGGHRRQGGSAGDYLGVATFEASFGAVEMTCTLPSATPGRPMNRSSAGVLVAVEPAPVLPAPLSAFGAWGAVPVALALGALLAVFAAVLRAAAPTTSR